MTKPIVYKSYLLKLVSTNHKLLNRFTSKLENSLNSVMSTNVLKQSLPTKRIKYTVLKSPHVNKKARDQYEQVLYTNKVVCTFTSNVVSEIKMKILLANW